MGNSHSLLLVNMQSCWIFCVLVFLVFHSSRKSRLKKNLQGFSWVLFIHAAFKIIKTMQKCLLIILRHEHAHSLLFIFSEKRERAPFCGTSEKMKIILLSVLPDKSLLFCDYFLHWSSPLMFVRCIRLANISSFNEWLKLKSYVKECVCMYIMNFMCSLSYWDHGGGAAGRKSNCAFVIWYDAHMKKIYMGGNIVQ